MSAPTLTVTGQPVTLDVPPRTSLADLLREKLRLTGTHLGCEHGVCGACTVVVDGRPVRSCIVLAVSCEGRDVRPIESFEDDPVMAELRAAFRQEHALQCGFCTPGMLIAAWDIVLRLPDADEARVRRELAGNLCRCTGYVGIVRAVLRVIETRRERGEVAFDTAPAATPRRAPVRATAPEPTLETQTSAGPTRLTGASRKPDARIDKDEPRAGWTSFAEEFSVESDVDTVWWSLSDFPLVASCLPGVELTEHDANSAKGRMSIKLGPMKAAFAGSASVEFDEANKRGRIRGAGGDKASGSRTKGDASFQVVPNPSGAGSTVILEVAYNLQGPLAQFSRSGLAQDLGRRLVADFASNLDRKLRGEAPQQGGSASLDAGGLAVALLASWTDRLLRKIGLRR